MCRVVFDRVHHDEGLPQRRRPVACRGEADGANRGSLAQDVARLRVRQAARKQFCAQEHLHGAGPVRSGARPVLHAVLRYTPRVARLQRLCDGVRLDLRVKAVQLGVRAAERALDEQSTPARELRR
eukprot:5181866-Prymnesium_polylepis.2